jgi:UPF0755 protein
MTIRSGGRPRDPRDAQAHPFEADAYATEYVPEGFEPSRRGSGRGNSGGRRGGRRGGGFVGLLKFLAFALVLAAIVLVVALTALRPVVNSAVLSWAADNPAALRLPFIADLVEADLGPALVEPMSSDPAQVEFVVDPGDTATTIATRLQAEGLIKDQRAFVFIASKRALTGALQSGTFILRKSMTPDQMVTALLAPQEVPAVSIALRTGLRLEQITALLQTLPLDMQAKDFYDLAKHPPAALVNDYQWLKKILADAPKGASLEGFLWPATYRVLPDTTPDELIRLMLDKFALNVGPDRLAVPATRGLNFYQVLSLASIVEREAVLDEERPLIAGVYQNRLNGLPGIKNKILNADPTVIYAADTVALAQLDFAMWQKYAFWIPPKVPLKEVVVPPDLAGYQTYLNPGLIPGPIATPSLPSIDAALDPDTKDKYLYFLAIPDGGGAHVFAKTAKQHDANRRQYGYLP